MVVLCNIASIMCILYTLVKLKAFELQKLLYKDTHSKPEYRYRIY
jgi:hypothetical protein